MPVYEDMVIINDIFDLPLSRRIRYLGSKLAVTHLNVPHRLTGTPYPYGQIFEPENPTPILLVQYTHLFQYYQELLVKAIEEYDQSQEANNGA